METGGSLSGKTALVTGASRGIGEAVARALAAEGARVGVAARSGDVLVRLADEIDGWPIVADLSGGDDGQGGGDPASAASAVDGMLTAFRAFAGGDPDILVASAGTFSLASIEDTTPEVFEANWALNVRASFLSVRGVLPEMRRRGSGVIVQIGSIAGRSAFPANAAYAASKFGVRGFHAVLVEELRGSGVRATLIEPAATDTPIWDPMNPDLDPFLPARSAMLRPLDVARAVVFVASRPAGVAIPYLPIESNPIERPPAENGP